MGEQEITKIKLTFTSDIKESDIKNIDSLTQALDKLNNVKVNNNITTIIKDIGQALQSFKGVNISSNIGVGITGLVTALSNTSKIKPMDKTVIGNAEMLAQAINVLDKNVTSSTPKMNAMSRVAKTLGTSFKGSGDRAKGFGNSLRTINFAAFVYGIQRITRALKTMIMSLYSSVDAFGQVENTMSFFGQSLGSQAESTAKIIQSYADTGAISFTHFADNVAKMNQIYKGYGIEAENSAKMALNMTQLAYDASYALGENGKDIDLWMSRATSVGVGQTRAGYFFGVDTGVKNLAEEFDGLTSSTDKGTRALAAYETMLANTTAIQGQMGRELGNSYVQMEVLKNRIQQLKQSIGRALIPMFQQLIKWALVALKVVELVIDGIVKLFGGKGFSLINYEDMIQNSADSTGALEDATQGVADGMGQATKNAKEYKKTVSGIDQVFTINDTKTDSGGGKDKGIGGVGGLGGDVSGYDLFDQAALELNKIALAETLATAQKIVQKIKDLVPWVAAVAAGFLGWKIAKGLMDSLKWISGLKGISGGLGLDKLAFGVGFVLFLADLKRFKDAFDDFAKNGKSFDNVAKMLSSFVGMIGDIFIVFGQIKIGGALKVVQGITEVVRGIKEMGKTGVSWNSVDAVLFGLSNVAIGIGLLKGEWAVVGVGLVMQGGLAIIKEISENWELIKQGDWTGVDKVALFIGGIQLLGGVAVAIAAFKKIVDVANAGKGLSDAATATETMSTATGGVSKSLVGLAKNIAVGVGLLALVAAGAIIFVGSIIILGEELRLVGEAWKPVIENGGTVTLGILLGTTLLVAIGTAAFSLGSAAIGSAGTIPLAIAAGVAMLILISEATKYFVREITWVGIFLEQVGLAWDPVLKDGDTIIKGITLGTILLIGVATAVGLLGVAAASTGGTLPLAIAAGTAMLVLFSVATKLLIKEVSEVGNQLANQLAPAMEKVSKVMPDLNNNTRDFTKFMIVFAGHMVVYAASSAVAGLAGTISTIIGWFTKDPIKKMKDDANKNEKQFKNLNTQLEKTNPLVKKGDDLMVLYIGLLNKFKKSVDRASSIGTYPSIGVDFEKFSKSLKDGFKDLDGIKTQNVAKIMTALNSLDLNKFKGIGTSIVKQMELGITSYNFKLNSVQTKIKNGLTFTATYIGSRIASDLVGGINNSYVNISRFSNRIKNGLTFNGSSIGSNIANGIVRAINNASVNVSNFNNRVWDNVGFNGYSIGTYIAQGVINGINGKYVNITPFTNDLKRSMKRAFDVRSPSRWARDVIGQNIGLGVEGGVNDTKLSFDPFKDNVSSSMYDIMDGIDVSPKVNMPTFDTRGMNSDISKVSQSLNASVQSQFDYTNDGTEKAVEDLKVSTVEMFGALIEVVKDGTNLYVDGDKIGEISDKYTKENAVRLNTVFGR